MYRMSSESSFDEHQRKRLKGSAPISLPPGFWDEYLGLYPYIAVFLRPGLTILDSCPKRTQKNHVMHLEHTDHCISSWSTESFWLHRHHDDSWTGCYPGMDQDKVAQLDDGFIRWLPRLLEWVAQPFSTDCPNSASRPSSHWTCFTCSRHYCWRPSGIFFNSGKICPSILLDPDHMSFFLWVHVELGIKNGMPRNSPLLCIMASVQCSYCCCTGENIDVGGEHPCIQKTKDGGIVHRRRAKLGVAFCSTATDPEAPFWFGFSCCLLGKERARSNTRWDASNFLTQVIHPMHFAFLEKRYCHAADTTLICVTRHGRQSGTFDWTFVPHLSGDFMSALVLLLLLASSSTMWVQCDAPDLNRDLVRSGLLAGPQPRSCEISVACRTSTAILWDPCCVPDLNRDPVRSVLRTGPRPRSCEVSVACRTSTAILWDQGCLPDLNRDPVRSVLRAGPQPRSCAIRVAYRTSTAILWGQCCVPDLNRDHVRSVLRAGPQPRSCEISVARRASTAKCVRKKNVRKNVKRYVRRYVGMNVKRNARKNVRRHVRRYVRKIVKRYVRKNFKRYVRRYVGMNVKRNVRKNVRRHVRRYVRKIVKRYVRKNVRRYVRKNVRRYGRKNVKRYVRTKNVRRYVRKNVKRYVRKNVRRYVRKNVKRYVRKTVRKLLPVSLRS